MKSLAQLNKYFLKYKWRFLLGILFVVAQNFFALWPIEYVGKSIDAVVESLNNYNAETVHSGTLVSELTEKIFYFLLIIIGLGILRGIIMFMMRQTMIVMSRL